MKFSHLHVHTQFSLLDGAASIKNLYKKAIADGMPALAISDHGNMFGAFEFVKEAYSDYNKNADGTLKVKPVVGCEFYITSDRHRKTFSKEEKDPRNHQILLAKNDPDSAANDNCQFPGSNLSLILARLKFNA